MTKALFLLIGFLLFIAAPFEAHAQACGVPIRASVSLTADLLCPLGSDGIVVGADNVRIDLNGFTVSGPPSLTTRGVVSSGYKGVKLVGPGSIEGFQTAVHISGGSYHEIRGVSLFSVPGAQQGGSGEIVLLDTTASLVDDTRAGVVSISSDGKYVSDGNRVSRSQLLFVYVYGCSTTNTVIEGNKIRNGANAYSVTIDNARATKVVANEIGGGSLTLRSASDSVIEGNTVYAAPVAYAAINIWTILSPCSGPVPAQATGNQVRDNTIYASTFGIGIGDGAVRNQVTENRILDPIVSGLIFFAGADDNDARRNRINNGAPLAIDLGSRNLWP